MLLSQQMKLYIITSLPWGFFKSTLLHLFPHLSLNLPRKGAVDPVEITAKNPKPHLIQATIIIPLYTLPLEGMFR
jgi:hypothetical protein